MSTTEREIQELECLHPERERKVVVVECDDLDVYMETCPECLKKVVALIEKAQRQAMN